MKHFAKLFLFAALVFSTSSCVAMQEEGDAPRPEKKTTRMTLNVKNFHALELCNMEVHFRQGNTQSVQVVAPSNWINHMKYKVEDGELELRPGFSNYRKSYLVDDGNYTVKAYITAPDLTALELYGCYKFIMDGNLDTDRLNVDLSGSGKALFNNVISNTMDLDASGASELSFTEVRTGSIDTDVAGAAKLKLSLVKVKKSELDVSGAANAKVSLKQCGEVVLVASGASTLSLDGTADDVALGVSGAAKTTATLNRVPRISAESSGAAYLNLSMKHCGKVLTQATGAGKIELSGEAKNINKDVSGAGKINNNATSW